MSREAWAGRAAWEGIWGCMVAGDPGGGEGTISFGSRHLGESLAAGPEGRSISVP